MIVVALSGRAAAGKDSFAAGLLTAAAELGKVGVTISFAETLKRVTCDIWGVDSEYMRSYEGKALLRPRLVLLGCFVREIDPNAWVDAVVRKIQALRAADLVVIPDLRFMNEASRLFVALPNADVRIVRISASVRARSLRMGETRFNDYVETGLSTDPSESQMDVLDVGFPRSSPMYAEDVRIIRDGVPLVTNDGTLAELAEQAKSHACRLLSADGRPTSSARKALQSAFWNLAHGLGPEARLLL